MAGWMVAWTNEPSRVDDGAWKQAVLAAGRYGERLQESISEQVRLAVWHRTEHEFPYSGTIVQTEPDTRVAWIGQCLNDSGDASLQAAEMVSKRGPEFSAVSELNGPWAAAVIHDGPRAVSVWTDRFSQYPVYLYRKNGISVASTEMRCVLPWLADRRFDPVAVDMLLRLGEFVDGMTLFRDVEFLGGGTWIHDDGSQVVRRKYWRYELDPDFSLSLEDYAQRFAELVTSATRRFESLSLRLGVPLSGGLDSRMCLALCRDPRTVPSFTWGVPTCRDVRYAKAFACSIASPHHVHLWDPPGFVPLWPTGVDATGGCYAVHTMFVLPYVRMLARHCDVVLNGLAGDGILGGSFLHKQWMREKSLGTLAQIAWRWRVSPEEDHVVNQLSGMSGTGNPSRERWCQSFCDRPVNRPIDRMNGWLVENRVFRFTNCGTMLLRSGVESHTIFFDRHVVDLLMRTPVEYKWKHRLYFEIVKRACPTAGNVRWHRSGVPPAWGFWPNLGGLALQRGVRMLFKPFKIDPLPALKVADPGQWFRNEWSLATERLLLSDRTLGRGILQPDAVRALWRAHQNGADCSRQLGMLVTLELFARMAVDQEKFETVGCGR